ncbi:MAG: hypothetical protein JST86_20160 [Bacteroidetes bacterium]|nr:hypothetical protein [Bacteroidota bacterium]
MTPFTFILKDNTRKAFNNFFWFLFCLHIIAASVMVIKNTGTATRNYATGAAGVWALLSVLFYLLRNHIKLYTYQLLVLATMILFWLLQAAWLPALVILTVVVFSLWLLQKKSSVTFSADGVILMKTIVEKKYAWGDLANVVLKDGLLTIDTQTNHLLQLELDAATSTADEQSFNQFCSNCLRAS